MEHRLTMPLRNRDLDTLGHLNQAVYHELLEDVRVGLVARLVGPSGLTDWVLARSELDYLREVRLDAGAVELVARVLAVGTKSVTIEQLMLLPDGETAASGRAILVAWDGDARQSRAITDAEREALQASAP